MSGCPLDEAFNIDMQNVKIKRKKKDKLKGLLSHEQLKTLDYNENAKMQTIFISCHSAYFTFELPHTVCSTIFINSIIYADICLSCELFSTGAMFETPCHPLSPDSLP